MAVKRKRRATRGTIRQVGPARRGTWGLAVVLGALLAVNLYVFLWRKGTSLPDVQKAALLVNQEHHPAAATGPAAPLTTPETKIISGKVEKNDSLGRLLRRAGLTAQAADEVIRSLAETLDFRAIRGGQVWRLELDTTGRVMSFELELSKVEKVRTARDATGALVGHKNQAATRIEVEDVGGTIDSSLYASIKAAGEQPNLVAFFVDVFAYDVDFYTETHPGDTFRVVVEKEYMGNELLGYKRILAAEYAGKAGSYRALYWQGTGDKARYFDEKGQAVERSMLKTPLKFARVSSRFNPKRMHPVLHRVKGHFGVDYAAPTGTPVWASGSGRIVSRGWAGGAGNMVVLAHDGGLTTLYMHLSKFAPGQKVGQRIDAKTVIGYVGTTGLSTGPHLHFGVKKNGAYVDPFKLAPLRRAGVSKADRPRFEAETAPVVSRLTAIATPARRAADDGTGLGDNEPDQTGWNPFRVLVSMAAE